jgi:endo-1,4-beta-xylanase
MGWGLQMHLRDLNPDVEGIRANIERFIALGIQVHITDMDVALRTDAEGKVVDPEDLVRQAELYRQIAQAVRTGWAVRFKPGASRTNTRGFVPPPRGVKGSALPFDRNYVAKPAYEALRAAVAGGN